MGKASLKLGSEEFWNTCMVCEFVGNCHKEYLGPPKSLYGLLRN